MSEIRFIKACGYIFISLSAGCLYTIYCIYSMGKVSIDTYYFGIGVSLFYLVSGIGILMRKKWGYYILKLFLFLFIINFPIGTIIAYKSLSYMKKKNIKQFFMKGQPCHGNTG